MFSSYLYLFIVHCSPSTFYYALFVYYLCVAVYTLAHVWEQDNFFPPCGTWGLSLSGLEASAFPGNHLASTHNPF